jgi:hypothetical protein
MNKYQDKYTRYHDKPVNSDKDPSSNNGWVYSAYAKYLAPNTTDFDAILSCFDKCNRSKDGSLLVDRSPNDPTPPLSKDEIVGMVSFAQINDIELKKSHWNHCNLEYEKEPLSFKNVTKAVIALLKMNREIKKLGLEGSEKRNYVWEKEIKEAYCLAFLLPLQDQYYVNRFYGKSTTLLQKIFFYISLILTLTKGGKSSRMMLWLQLSDLNHWCLRFVPKNKWVRDYFDPNHPFVKGLEK